MKVICLHKKAFYTLLDRVFKHIESRMEEEREQEVKTRWINGEEVMELLQIKSTTTLQRLRDNREVRFSQPFKKVILYDRYSVYEYLEKYAIEPD